MKRILVVEDNEDSRYLCCFMLEKEGFQVDSCGSGITALEMAEHNDYDLILLDIQLPAVDGITVLHALRKTSKYEKRPIIAITAYAMRGDREKFLREGFDEYVSKPIKINLFLEKVKDSLNV